jgi:hypothetical protein
MSLISANTRTGLLHLSSLLSLVGISGIYGTSVYLPQTAVNMLQPLMDSSQVAGETTRWVIDRNPPLVEGAQCILGLEPGQIRGLVLEIILAGYGTFGRVDKRNIYAKIGN